MPPVREIVAIDIGGTHARFALATVGPGATELKEAVTLKAAEYAGLNEAWVAYEERLGRPLPPHASIGIASPVDSEAIKLTNSHWVIRRKDLTSALGLESYTIVNDFGAIAHAIGHLRGEDFAPLCGPILPLPRVGVISVVGPGTGLGVAQIVRRHGSDCIVETEAGHISFAPADATDRAVYDYIAKRFQRASYERVLSGAGLVNIYAAISPAEKTTTIAEIDLWNSALNGDDFGATLALDRFCTCLGAYAGDMALAHGASAVIIGGGLGYRLANVLPKSGFAAAFTNKGRFEQRMVRIPVLLIRHPEPGLLGAAAAYAHEHF